MYELIIKIVAFEGCLNRFDFGPWMGLTQRLVVETYRTQIRHLGSPSLQRLNTRRIRSPYQSGLAK